MLHMDLLDVKKKMGSKNSLDIIRTSWGSGNRDVSNKYLGLSENWVTPNHENSWKIPIKKIAIWATCSVGRGIMGLKTYEGSLSKSNIEPQPDCLRMINSRWLMMHHGGWWIKNASWWIMYDGNFGKYLRSHSSQPHDRKIHGFRWRFAEQNQSIKTIRVDDMTSMMPLWFRSMLRNSCKDTEKIHVSLAMESLSVVANTLREPGVYIYIYIHNFMYIYIYIY